MIDLLPDGVARTRAATATDRNIVVTAGAGTGKTTLLVNRLIHLLLHQPQPVGIGEIVALTFTNKAATEMKVRLRAELGKHGDHSLAAKALRELEQSQIGTIHSFAAHLLRLYPVESGVDPAFKQDEGAGFKSHFDEAWALWLDSELGPAGAHHDVWRAALQAATLDELKQLAMELAGELIPLDGQIGSLEETSIPAPIRGWLIDLARTATALRDAHPETNTLERMLDAAAAYLRRMAESGRVAANGSEILDREAPGITAAWSSRDHAQAKHIIRTTQALMKVEAGPLTPLLRILISFARDCRSRFVQSGSISFDGLLARARNLLRDYPQIRRDLKSQFRAILVDEFQDTDPVQYEMILYLAEASAAEEADWRRVRLEPGKLFIVGDPKQSIYAFRRADMEAYDAVVEDQVLSQTPPGERHTLHTNFRSHDGLLASINGFFDTVFPPQPLKGLQPQNDPLEAYETDAPRLPFERVELHIARPDEPEADADAASRAEAEELARWLSEDVLGREEIYELGSPVKIKPGHVAILFRKLTGLREYLEALRRYRIPCLADGEKHFYERQEIIDAVNLLRAIANPHDRLALVGVLRSSLGAVPDDELAALAHDQLLDYRIIGSSAIEQNRKNALSMVAPLYGLLRELHQEIPRLPLTDVMDTLLHRTPLAELAAASMDGEQALANLFRLRDIIAELALRPDLTLQGLVAELTVRANETPDEAESSLLEEATNGSEPGAVRLLSIHKAKGLEFPVVILAGLHRGTDRGEPRTAVHHDWSTGILGARLGDLQTVGGIYVGAKLAERRRYEQSRVLYVAMTRAKRRLILSAGLPRKVPSDSFLSCVGEEIDQEALANDGEFMFPFGSATIPLCVVSTRAAASHRHRQQPDAWREAGDSVVDLTARWDARTRRWEEASTHGVFTNPTALKRAADAPESAEGVRSTGAQPDHARLIGILAHRVLEDWDFERDPAELHQRVEAICRFGIPSDLSEPAESIAAELHAIFKVFATSSPYADIRRATILGREMPFTIPWDQAQTQHSAFGAQHFVVMEGVIDLVYCLEGRVWIADYKTDRVEEHELENRVKSYGLQARIYREAVSRCLGLDAVGCLLVFLRNGTAVPITGGSPG